jgi:hypothetical protein
LQALDWIEANLGEPVDRSKPYEDVLKDGIVLFVDIGGIVDHHCLNFLVIIKMIYYS